jgi:hypothetical protein
LRFANKLCGLKVIPRLIQLQTCHYKLLVIHRGLPYLPVKPPPAAHSGIGLLPLLPSLVLFGGINTGKIMYEKHRQYQLGDILGAAGGGGFSGSSSAQSSASTSVSPVVSSGGGLNIWEILIAAGVVIVLGLFLTLNRRS